MTNKEFKKLKGDLWLPSNNPKAESDSISNDYSPQVFGLFLKIYLYKNIDL
jgi:SOS-response transcriptional repressor LexA